MFIIWLVDDKVDCSAASVPKDLSLTGFWLADIRWGLDGLDSSPPLGPPRNSVLELDCLGSKPSAATYSSGGFAKLLLCFNLMCQMELTYYLLRVIVRIKRKLTQGIWNRDPYNLALRKSWLF